NPTLSYGFTVWVAIKQKKGRKMSKYKEIDQEVRRGKDGSQEDLIRLMERFHPLILSSIEKYCPLIGEREDLIQEGRIVLLEVVKEYDQKLKIPFAGFLKARLRFFYLEKGRELMEEKPLSLDYPGEEGQTLLESLSDGKILEDFFVTMENSKELRMALETLTPRQRFVIEGYYLEHLHISEIAGFMGVSTSTIYNTKRRALEKLREELKDCFYP
ncbi:MAG: sigma-70 family RNA polymerase sigma factor, partial [Tissierellia bacterium]|nr:sigma-70 family RNA polymerase sigma factor [Tissierellia bacterium]